MTFLSQFTPYSFPLLGLVRLPKVVISAADKAVFGLRANASNSVLMRHLCWAGYLKKRGEGRFKDIDEHTVKERLRTEFDVFEKTGTYDYFLLLWDINRWCDQQGILRGVGRGSSAGSLAMFCLNITDINPLEYGLFFARFLSEARTKPKTIDGVLYIDGKTAPDVDSDYEFSRRDEVLKYIEDKYQGRTAKISTRMQFTGKTALQSVLKAYLEYDMREAMQITDLIEEQYGTVESLSQAIERSKELKAWVAESARHQAAFDIGRALETLNEGKGVHPSGIFLSYAPLDGSIATELTKDGDLTTCCDMNVAATLGLKADILGIRNLSVVGEACKHAGITAASIDINHPSIYEYYGKTDVYGGLFQIHKGLSKQTVIKIKPRNMDELAACMALPRPGALKYIDQYKYFVQDGTIKPIYPALDEILKSTGGIILYQETITEVCVKLFGMTEIDADQVRYYVGKKLKIEMQKIEPVLYERGRAMGVPDEIVKYFWDTCNASADYLFVRGHAFSYANLCALTTYMKVNHPREFTLARLKMSKHEPKPQEVLSDTIQEAAHLDVKILPPDILKSGDDFSVEEGGVRFGLSHIRGISDANMSKLLSFRRDFTSTFDVFNAAQEAKISISVLVGLIMCGCISSTGSRAKLALEAQTYNLLTPRETLLVRKLGAEYDYDLLSLIKALGAKTDEKGKPYIKDSRLVTLRRDFAPYEQMYRENSRNEELTTLLFERHLLGFSYSSTLKSVYAKKVEGLMSIDDVLKEPANINVRFVGFVDEVKKAISLKSRKPYVKYTLSDETGAIKVMLHGEQSIESVSQFHGELPSEGDIIIVSGSKGDGDMVFASVGRAGSSFVRQTNPVRLKKGEFTIDI